LQEIILDRRLPAMGKNRGLQQIHVSMSGADFAGQKAMVGGSAGLASHTGPITKLQYTAVMRELSIQF
jgi:hypothetical protein